MPRSGSEHSPTQTSSAVGGHPEIFQNGKLVYCLSRFRLAGNAAVMVTTPVTYNVFEILLWGVLGCEFLRRGLTLQRAMRLRCLLASVAFLLFAVSDAAEIYTGAWWRPWWLLAWKAACVIVLGSLYTMNLVARIRKTKRRGQRDRDC